ncbi:MAG: T9SS type A sorting domain-containing protein [Candidatus Latescibacter sp.]|nr:T9SS type A sorting domain-containing protein [Candidatus Latescibacter sp.]
MQYKSRCVLVIILLCFSANLSYAGYILTNSVIGNGAIEQSNALYSVNSTVGQVIIGQSDGQKNSIYNGFGYIPIALSPVKIQIEPPTDVKVADVPNDQGHFLNLTWKISLSEQSGKVQWYRIYRSQNSSFTTPIPITQFKSIDSLIVYEKNYTVLVDSVKAGIAEYKDAVPLNGVLYYYWLQAVGTGGESQKVALGIRTLVQDLPLRFFVYPPFPNPFNPATTFTISIPRDSHLVLSIYNISGQRVATITNEKVKAGHNSFSWNAQGMPSGIYFCKAQLENAVDIKKVMLLK